MSYGNLCESRLCEISISQNFEILKSHSIIEILQDFDFSDLSVLFDRVPLSLTGCGFWSRKPLKFDYGFLKGTRVQIAQIGGMLSLLEYGDVVRGARDASITEQLSQLLANKSNR